jgi:hypothetical protein
VLRQNGTCSSYLWYCPPGPTIAKLVTPTLLAKRRGIRPPVLGCYGWKGGCAYKKIEMGSPSEYWQPLPGCSGQEPPLSAPGDSEMLFKSPSPPHGFLAGPPWASKFREFQHDGKKQRTGAPSECVTAIFPSGLEACTPRYDPARAVGEVVPGPCVPPPILPRAWVRPPYSHPCRSLCDPLDSHLRGSCQNADNSSSIMWWGCHLDSASAGEHQVPSPRPR